jgi:hypothetical protein
MDAMDLLPSPGASVTVRFLIQKADAPIPHRKLCAVYHEPPQGTANGADYSKQKYGKTAVDAHTTRLRASA